MTRLFEDTEAKPGKVPLAIAVAGPSSGGKTFSALRLATGIQRVTGGDIHVIDTESKRALHYADRFRFRHVNFGAPFSPLDYLSALEHSQKRGAGVIVIDSGSHEHEGPGGVLEWHAAEMDRLGGGDDKKAEKMKMMAWGKPKAARRRLINAVLQMPITTIWCFRAKEKLEIVPGREPVKLGWMPIAGEEFLYEMTVRALLEPMVDGVPNWSPQRPGEREWVRVPTQFRTLFNAQSPHALCEADGEAMARWANGETQAGPRPGTFRAGKSVGKPLADATADDLLKYKEACTVGLAKKSGSAAEDLRAHIAEIDAELERRAGDGFGLEPPPADVEQKHREQQTAS